MNLEHTFHPLFMHYLLLSPAIVLSVVLLRISSRERTLHGPPFNPHCTKDGDTSQNQSDKKGLDEGVIVDVQYPCDDLRLT